MADTLTFIGQSKCYFAVQSRTGIQGPDSPGESPIDLSTLAAKAFDCREAPYLEFWGSCDTPGSMLTFALALFTNVNGQRVPMGVTQPCSLVAGRYINGDGVYIGDVPGTFDMGDAIFVYPIILDATPAQGKLTSWSLYLRPYGYSKYPC